MKPFFCALLVVCACQSDEKSAKQAETVARADQTYADDIRKLCDSMSLSGADKMEKLERVGPHSKWLGENLKTKAAQQFLIGLQPLQGEAKASALEAEAKRLGQTGCALAAEFR